MRDLVRHTSSSAEIMLQGIERRLDILKLDLSGLSIVTEAATGAYACTAVIAAMAGAKVHACACGSVNHGSAKAAISATRDLAIMAGVETRISYSIGVPPQALADCDILTNSGRIRPITREMIAALPERSVIALMFEAWEFRGTDIDLIACRDHDIRIAAVNERHADVAVFPFLGPLCVRLLADAAMTTAEKRIAVLCDNPFAPFLFDGLTEAGAEAVLFDHPSQLTEGPWDAVVVAMLPRDAPLGPRDLQIIASMAPNVLLAQFWGDIDREIAAGLGLHVWPEVEPGRGHMGILLNRLGHEPIVRLQAGGLKAAEIVWRGDALLADGVAALYSGE
ncbi:hypothetical protein [Manganibacter manganicus]|uniref:Uncharacterized protein n=1 Tax=Manganibacter manganicus TaxID=1873176 RepID=A0A1V8RME1_9HYPH|nr:hypothetical protein [Pseudaminobacter manganicus]OQM74360.1 hypothetical protein BFN67_05845 [Pseudaminobacter manganicus]